MRSGSLQPTPPDWLIDGVLETNSLAAIYGAPGVGKTHLATGMAASISAGVPFHGRHVQCRPVVMVAGEGHRGLIRRRTAHEIQWGINLNEAPLYFSERPAMFCDPDAAAAVADAVNQVAKEHGSVGLVVVDTLARNYGGDENSTKDMSAFIDHLDAIRAKHGCCVLIVHHTGHSDTKRARGSTALKGGLDAEYLLEHGRDGLLRLEAHKMKDAPLPDPMAFKLAPVNLGFKDDRGREVTSAALTEVAWTPPPRKATQRMGRNETKALEALRGLVRAHSGDHPEIPLDHWRIACTVLMAK